MTYYKVLGAGHRAIHGGDYTYTPGEWTPEREAVVCESGWHYTSEDDLVKYLYGEDADLPFEIWECEVRGGAYRSDKGVANSLCLTRLVGTLDEYDLRWLGTLFAETVLDNIDDPCIGECILAVREYCVGYSDRSALRAAESAAESAADSAAWSAAWSATESAAESAAYSAAESAAYRAAESAAWSATESAAYSAAWRNMSRIVIDYLKENER